MQNFLLWLLVKIVLIEKLLQPFPPFFVNRIRRLFNSFEVLTGYSFLRFFFYRANNYKLDLKDPKSFNQKICWKLIFDKHPLLPILNDKYKVRDYLKQILGEEEAQKILIPLLFVTDKPEKIPFDKLPEEYIIKPNYASGRLIIINKDTPINKSLIIKKCKKWLNEPYCVFEHMDWVPKIERKIIIEQLLRNHNSQIPTDFKFFVFHGKCYMIQVITKRFINAEISHYDRNLNHLNVGVNNAHFKKGDPVKKPDNFNAMINLAEFLASPFDFIRVDLYSLNGQIYFGELTYTPATGKLAYDPRSFNFKMGKQLKLIPEYWNKK